MSQFRICGSEEDLFDYVYLYLKDSRRLGVTEATDSAAIYKKCEVESCTTSTSCMVHGAGR